MDWENASEDWWMGANVLPISREAMTRFVTGDHDLYRDKQLRWMLDAKDAENGWSAVGALDLYDFEPRHQRAGVAIHVRRDCRRQGHGAAGLGLLAAYAQEHLGLHQLYAEVPADHEASMDLFRHAGYRVTGLRESWIRGVQGRWADVQTLQLILESGE